MARAGLNPQRVVEIAAELVQEQGVEGHARLSLAQVAKRAGVATPSLYKHINSLASLKRGVSILSLRLLADTLERAMPGIGDWEARLVAIAVAFRGFALEFPGLYAAAQAAPDPEAPADESWRQAGDRVLHFLAEPLQELDSLQGNETDLLRSVRAHLHGFIDLELRGGYRLDRDLAESFQIHVSILLNGLRHLARGA